MKKNTLLFICLMLLVYAGCCAQTPSISPNDSTLTEKYIPGYVAIKDSVSGYYKYYRFIENRIENSSEGYGGINEEMIRKHLVSFGISKKVVDETATKDLGELTSILRIRAQALESAANLIDLVISKLPKK